MYYCLNVNHLTQFETKLHMQSHNNLVLGSSWLALCLCLWVDTVSIVVFQQLCVHVWGFQVAKYMLCLHGCSNRHHTHVVLQ